MKTMIAALISLVTLTGCVTQEQRQANHEEWLRLQSAHDKAAVAAVYTCKDRKECDKAFALTRLFVESNSNMRIQYSDDVMVSTYNSRENFLSLKARRVPARGDGATIELFAWCRWMKESDGELGIDCIRKATRAYNAFRPYIDAHMN